MTELFVILRVMGRCLVIKLFHFYNYILSGYLVIISGWSLIRGIEIVIKITLIIRVVGLI